MARAREFIDSKLGGRYVSVHMRNGVDWENACKHAIDSPSYMSSTQCLQPGEKVTAELCRPTVATVAKELRKLVNKHNVLHVFLGTDTPNVRGVRALMPVRGCALTGDGSWQELEKLLNKGRAKNKQVKVVMYEGAEPQAQLDIVLFGQSEHFLGNCVSSFTAIAAREREVNSLPYSFSAYPRVFGVKASSSGETADSAESRENDEL
jgi:peptide-O-fucosyltransferase